MSPRTSSIVQIIFSFWSFEIRKVLFVLFFFEKSENIIIGLNSFSN